MSVPNVTGQVVVETFYYVDPMVALEENSGDKSSISSIYYLFLSNTSINRAKPLA